MSLDVNARSLAARNVTPLVVVDPGHGGIDTGAAGRSGVLEKTITLMLARIISDEIGSRYRVILTRSDDYHLNIPDRTAVANHEGADVFISLHTGGSPNSGVGGLHLFTYKSVPAPRLGKDSKPFAGVESESAVASWNDRQVATLEESVRLSKFLQQGIQRHSPGLDVDLNSAPVLVLSGAMAPSILIEIGYITNPTEEKALADQYYLKDLAKGIIAGLDDFFER